MTYDDTNLPGQNSARQAPIPYAPETAPPLGQIAAALAKAQGAYPEVKKSKEVTIQQRSGGTFKFSYAPLDAILDAVRKPLTDNGLAITQVLDGAHLHTYLIHESGEMLHGSYPVPRGEDIKTLGASITYLRRYCLQSMLGVAAEEDTDGPQNGQAPAQAPSKPLAAAVQDRLRDTGSVPGSPSGPGPVSAPSAPPVAAPEAPVTSEPVAPPAGATRDDAPPTEGGPEDDPAVVDAADDGQHGLTIDEFKRMAREKGYLTGFVIQTARALWPDGEFRVQQDIADLSDPDRWLLWNACIAAS